MEIKSLKNYLPDMAEERALERCIVRDSLKDGTIGVGALVTRYCGG